MKSKVLELLKKIPKGKVTTYKSLAEACNSKGYRAIGQVLKNNPRPDMCPCYKVVRSDGKIGGYSGKDPKNIAKKIELLRNDGIEIVKGRIDLKRYLFRV
ncbi:MAG: MGMT family protein [Candidatus Aenigmatarchaeota archaeon]